MDKPGYKTTEFWLTLAAAMVGLFIASGAVGSDHIAMKIAGFAAAALASLGYSVSRGIAKKAPASSSVSELKVPTWVEGETLKTGEAEKK